MKKTLTLCIFLLTILSVFAQKPEPVAITGTVLDQATGEPLEYATLVLQSVRNPQKVTGGITDINGKFSVETTPGKYNARVEYISYQTKHLPEQTFTAATDLGTIKLALDVAQLNEVDVVGERTTVEIRLDKKIYNVGSDLTVKGGSVTDVLDNVPSVSVDVEGTISLRGNESVRILINGKPSALSGLSSDALQQLPAEAIEKVEVITNPSARYDAEGSAGILNIILKQSKTVGLNGSVSVNVGDPKSYGGNVSLNYRSNNFNIFTNTSYRYRNSPGNALFEQENFNDDGTTASFQNEYRDYLRQSDGINTNIGFEFFIDSTSSITNSLVYGKSGGDDTANIDFYNFDALMSPTIQRNRYTNEGNDEEEIQYSVNYIKRFNEDGHQLTLDYQYSSGTEIENSIIDEVILGSNSVLDTEQTINDERQKSQLVQMDYVLPFGKDNNSQFEFGYRGNFNDFITDFRYGILENGVLDENPDYSNILNYTEDINAVYTQLGSKIGKFNILGGLRFEDSKIGVTLVNTNDVTKKNYNNWFPSLFLGYELTETEQFSVSYSKRLRRPRSRYINPFPSRSSNTNLFQGNPDLNPSYTDAFDLGYLKRWDKLSFNTSAYFNRTTGVFQFVTLENGDFVTIENVVVPVQVRTPVNLAIEKRLGMEFTTTYTPIRNYRFSWNLNLYNQEQIGDFTYTNFANEEVVQNFDSENFNWFTRLSAKMPLPAKIDFQTNLFYMGPSKDAQSTRKGMLYTNLAFSKEILNDKGSLSLNIRDLFNTGIRKSDTRTNTVQTYSEFQRRVRQVTLTFMYRFNEQLNKKSNRSRGNDNDGGGEMEFEG